MTLVLFVAASILTITSAQTGLCPAPNGDFANPSSEACTTFFRCVQNNPTLLRCPANQRFDFLFRICRPQDQVDCNSQLQVFAAPAVVPGLAGLGGLGGLGGLAGAGTVGGLPALGGAGGLAGFGGLLGGGLGAGLPNNGLITLLSQLDGNGQDGQGLATALTLSALMSQMKPANQAPISQYPAAPILPSTAVNPPVLQSPVANPGTVGLTNTIPSVRTSNGKTVIVIPQQFPQGQYQAQPGLVQGQSQGQSNGVYWSSGTGQALNVPQGQNIGQGQPVRVSWNGNSGTSQAVNVPQGQTLGQGQTNRVYLNGNSGTGQFLNLPQGQTTGQSQTGKLYLNGNGGTGQAVSVPPQGQNAGQVRQGQIRQGQVGQGQGQTRQGQVGQGQGNLTSILKALRSGNGGGKAVIRDDDGNTDKDSKGDN